MVFRCLSVCLPSRSLCGRARQFKKTYVAIHESASHMILSYPSTRCVLSFKLRGNIVEVHDRFVSEGKITLRLSKPAQDVAFCKVKPDLAHEICRFFHAIRNRQSVDARSLSCWGGGLSRTQNSDKLVIENRTDYPLGKPFPRRLRRLSIRNVELQRFDNRILRLTNLSVLSLEMSRISSVPKAIERLHLSRLCLKANELDAWPSIMSGSALAGSLLHLDLSENKIAFLPEDFWNLENLESLLITDNHLGGLPAVNLHRMKGLRNLHLKNNQLRCLPYAISQFRELESLSLGGNPWMSPLPSVGCNEDLKSLVHFASAVVLRNYGHLLSVLVTQLPRDLGSRLQVLRRCFRCRRVCGVDADWYVGHVELECIERIYSSVTVTRNESSPVCIRYYCSSYCRTRVLEFERFN